MIEFKNITKKFQADFWEKPFFALNDVSFNVRPGQVTGFLGANGAGKTTSLKILMKFIKADSGVINFNKCLGSNQNTIFSNIGYPCGQHIVSARRSREYVRRFRRIPVLIRASP